MNEAESVTDRATKLIDDAIETVRWCRFHLQERGVSEKLRELQISVAALALALHYEMDGEPEKAAFAMERATGRLMDAYDPHFYEVHDH
jgi:hypothetical protein